jgi:alpha-glucosidase (family GH31 glycosyl hydrolase)
MKRLYVPVLLVAPALTVMGGATGEMVSVKALTPNVIKVTNAAAGEQVEASRISVLNESAPSQSARLGDGFITSSGVRVTTGVNGETTIVGGTDRRIVDDGVRVNANGTRSLRIATSGGSFYGAGERGHKLRLNGDTLVMYNRQNYGYTGSDPRISQMNITMPLVVSSNGYGIVFDDYAPAKLVVGDTIEYISESRNPVSYYYINGAKSVADVVTAMTEVTGRQELPPLWTMGYITSKYGYHTQTETLSVVDSLKREGYPVDGIVLDLYWYGKEQDMGRFKWDADQWPDPKGMLRDLKKQGVNLITISQPYILRNGRGVDNYNELRERSLMVLDSTGGPQEVKIWVGEGGMFDVSNPQTRIWLANKYAELVGMGVGGLWGDLGEPEVHPETGLHANGLTAREYHNIYGNDWSAIKYDMYKSCFPDQRIILMMRGGTTGLQRYDVFPWSTDVSRSWGGLEPQVRIMLNSGLSGLGYMGHDVGGFAIDPANPVDPELYVRWLQLGLFSPMLRTHAQYMAEPYGYPEQADIIKRLIADRYRWLPYNYTLAWDNATKGWPLVRPLNFHMESGVTDYDNISDEYLWGRDVLVAPVMTQGARSRKVTFPKDSQWVDIANPRVKYAGGTTATYKAPLDVLPLFARAGAFIPMADYKMENTGDYRQDRYTIQYYPVQGVASQYQMFQDDLHTPSSKSANAGRVITFAGEENARTITVGITSNGTFAGAPAETELTMVFNGLAKKPASIRLAGSSTPLPMTWDKKTGAATVTFNTSFDAPVAIVVTK